MKHIYATYNDAPTGGLFRLLDAEHTRPFYAPCPAWRFCRPSGAERAASFQTYRDWRPGWYERTGHTCVVSGEWGPPLTA